MRDIVIIGAGGMIGNILELFNLNSSLVYIHDEPINNNEIKYGVPVEKRPVDNGCKYISCVGDPRYKRSLISELKDAEFVNFIDSWTKIVATAKLGVGIFAQPFTVVWNNAEVGDHVLLLSTCNIGHHSKIGSYSTICPGAVISGHVTVGEGVWVGANASIRDELHIGEGALIGIGTNVVSDVKPNAVVVGNPAKVLRSLAPW